MTSSSAAVVIRTRTTVVAVSPADQLLSVPINANVRIVFSGPLDPLSVTAATAELSDRNQTAVPGATIYRDGHATSSNGDAL
jgi:hypothetical protein